MVRSSTFSYSTVMPIFDLKKMTPYCLSLALLATPLFPTDAALSQTNGNIINVPPPYIPPSSAPLPPSIDSGTDQQVTASERSRPDVLDRIMSTDPDTIDIKEENRSDLRTCDATHGEAMLIALYNCWPVLDGFQAYFASKKMARDYRRKRWELVRENPDYRQSEAYEASQQAEYEDTIGAAKQIEALAGRRDYPMQDMLLLLADIMQIAVAQKRKDYETALSHFDNSIMVFETTRITEPAFANLAILKKQRERIVKRMERLDQ